MKLEYEEEKLEQEIYNQFYEDTKELWSQTERPTIKDFIKWAIIHKRFADTYISKPKGLIVVASTLNPLKCPKCEGNLVKDESMVLASMPPKYQYVCDKCGHVEYKNY